MYRGGHWDPTKSTIVYTRLQQISNNLLFISHLFSCSFSNRVIFIAFVISYRSLTNSWLWVYLSAALRSWNCLSSLYYQNSSNYTKSRLLSITSLVLIVVDSYFRLSLNNGRNCSTSSCPTRLTRPSCSQLWLKWPQRLLSRRWFL